MKKQYRILSLIALFISLAAIILAAVNFGRSNVFVALSVILCLLIGCGCLLIVVLKNPERFTKKR